MIWRFPMKLFALALLSLPVFADPVGSLNTNVTQANIYQTVCVSGWTKTIRPPVSYTQSLKAKQMATLHLSGALSDYEEDHYIPLSIGGNPTDPNNLFPQPWPEARKKDVIERALHRLVCTNKITLQEAQARIKHFRDYIK